MKEPVDVQPSPEFDLPGQPRQSVDRDLARPPAGSSASGGVMRREFTTWSALSMGFVLVSPIVAMYTVFGAGVTAVGPSFWWGWVVAAAGQLAVAVTFGVLASRWPLTGGVYQWSRRLGGERYGWFAGWSYMWTFVISMTAVSSTGAVFLFTALGLGTPSPTESTMVGGLLVAAAAGINCRGRRVVRFFAYACIAAEVIGSIGTGVWLLIFHHINSPTVVGNPFTSTATQAGFASTPILLATMYAGWTFLGFESASTLAEEVPTPRRDIPRALVGSMICIGAVVLFTGFAILLASPEWTWSAEGDPVVATLSIYLPTPLFRMVMGLFVIAYIACAMGLNSGAGRMLWSYARDDEVPFSRTLQTLSPRTNTPVAAMVTTAAIAVILYLPFQSERLSTMLITFVSAGFFISFCFPVLGLAVAKVRRRWDYAQETFLGSWGHCIAWLAAIWLVLETINIIWPRTGDPTIDWAPFGVTAALVGLGIFIRRLTAKADPLIAHSTES